MQWVLVLEMQWVQELGKYRILEMQWALELGRQWVLVMVLMWEQT